MDHALLRHLLAQPEGERLEFKEWTRKADVEALCRYCCALANEGGGHLVLGVTDRRPRKIVGTTVFGAPGALDAVVALVRGKLGVEVRADPLSVDGKRVVVFTAPSRPRGALVLYRRRAYERQGESLMLMEPGRWRAIMAEADAPLDPG